MQINGMILVQQINIQRDKSDAYAF